MARKPKFRGLMEEFVEQIGNTISESVEVGIAKSGIVKELINAQMALDKAIKKGRMPGKKSGLKPGRKRSEPKKCMVSGCKNDARAKGMCSKHYQRERYQEKKKVRKTGKDNH